MEKQLLIKTFLENNDTTINILAQHKYANLDDIFIFFEEEVFGRGKGTIESAKDIYNNIINCCGYFDSWYKFNRNKKWYAEMKEKGLC